MTDALQDTPRRLAALAADGVDAAALGAVKKSLEAEGVEFVIVSPVSDVLAGTAPEGGAMGPAPTTVDRSLFETDASAYFALMAPDGVASVDALRAEPRAVAFVRAFLEAQKPIAAAGHGPWMLIDGGGAAGRRLTSTPSIRVDLINAGADWVDEAVIEDGPIVTAQSADAHDEYVQAVVKSLGLR